MYRLATKQDIPGITALWQEAFHETPILPDCDCFVAELDGRIVGMLFAMPQKLKSKALYKAVYFYAVATKEEYRGRGICRALMAYAEAHTDADCCVLVPASESLFDFYEKLGYKTAFYRKKTPFPGGAEISMEEYLLLREQLLSEEVHMVYDDLRYAQRIYGLKFYKTAGGICAASEAHTAETLPEDLGGKRYGMIKWLREEEAFQDAYLGFALD